MSKAKPLAAVTTIGLRRSHLDLVVMRDGPRGKELRTATVEWRKQSTTPASEAGQAELRAGLKELLSREKPSGARVRVCLGGDFCVTRVVTGPADHVRRELAQLEERSALYLSLGTGPKALAVSVRQTDARRQHALLTVVNRRVLNSLVRILGEAGLKADVIEPSLVGLSRLLGQTGRDAEQAALIVNVSERGIELGVTHQGQLLLDYRPGGRVAPHEAPQIVQERLLRIQRYCQRSFRLPELKLNRIVLSGPDGAVAKLRDAFAEDPRLSVEVLRPVHLGGDLGSNDDLPSSQYSAAAGTCLHTSQTAGPNLMDRLQNETREPLPALIARTSWPIAAALLIAVGFLGAAVWERSHGLAVAAEVAAQEGKLAAARALEDQIAAAQEQIRHLESLQAQLAVPPWREVVTTISQSLPHDVWLENLHLTADGRIAIGGASYTEDGAFEFVGWLQKNPYLRRVALEETRPTAGPSGPATHFDIHCDLAEVRGGAAEANLHD